MKKNKLTDMSKYAPCIVSKAKMALQLKNRYKGNNKKCSDEYWENVVKKLAANNNVTDDKIIKKAIKRTDLYR